MFLVSYDCNFRCPYCYEGGISGDGRHWTQQRFSKELVDKAYQAMEQIEPRKERQGHVITLYGGEPLMKENKEIVNYILEQGKKNGFYFRFSTVWHNRLRNKHLTEYLRNSGNELETVRFSAICGAMLSNNSFLLQR